MARKPTPVPTRPFGLPWLDSCYQESLLPEAPWHQVRDLLCESLAEKMQKHLENERRREVMFQMVGPQFVLKYFPNYDMDPQILESPRTSPEDKQRVIVDTTNWMQVAVYQAASDVRCQRPDVVQDEEAMIAATSDTGNVRSWHPAINHGLKYIIEDVAEEMEEFLHHTKSLITKGMERHLYLQEKVLVEKKKQKMHALDLMREDEETWAKWQAAEQRRQGLAQVRGILKRPPPQLGAQGQQLLTPNSGLYTPEQKPPQTAQIRAGLYEPEAQPPLWGHQADSLGRSLIALLKRNPSRFSVIAWRLHGRQLPGTLRTYVWLDVLLLASRESHRGADINVEKLVRERFGKMVSRGMEEMKITRATHSPISSLIDKAVLEMYDSTAALKAYVSDDKQLHDAGKALNVLYCFDRSYEPHLILWLFPLQLAFREHAGEREHAYELALYLHLVARGCFPSWPEVFSLAEGVLEALRLVDDELLLHLREVSVVGAKLDTKDFMLELLHIEKSKAEQLKKNKASTSKGAVDGTNLFMDPLIYIRKWVGEGFVSALDTPAVLWVWDQLFLEKWDRKVMTDTCLALLLLLKHKFMETEDHASMAKVFQKEPCKLYTKDIQRAWMHLQYGGHPNEVPYFNRRRPSMDAVWQLYQSLVEEQPTSPSQLPAGAQSAPPSGGRRPSPTTLTPETLDPVGIKGVVIYVIFSADVVKEFRWVASFNPEDVKLLCTVFFGTRRLTTQVTTKPAQCPMGARELDSGSVAYKIYFPKSVLKFKGLDISRVKQQSPGAHPFAALQADYYGHADTKAGRALPITLGWARIQLHAGELPEGNKHRMVWPVMAQEAEFRLHPGSVPDSMSADPADLPPTVEPAYIQAESNLKGIIFNLERDPPPSPEPTILVKVSEKPASLERTPAKPATEEKPKEQTDKTKQVEPVAKGSPRKAARRPSVVSTPPKKTATPRTVSTKKKVPRRQQRDPTPPPGPDAPDIKSTFDLYIDRVENIPDSATIIKVTGRLIKTGALSGIPDLLALPEINSSARSPVFKYRQKVNTERLTADHDMLVLLRVYTVDKNSKNPKDLCVIGSCLFGFFTTNGYLRVGGHRCALHTGMPDLSKGVGVLNPRGLDNASRIPACSILIRLLPSSEKLVAVPDDDSYYRNASDISESDQRVANSYDADPTDPEIKPQTCVDMVTHLKVLEEILSAEVPRIWLRDRLDAKKWLQPNQPAGNLPLSMLVEYRQAVGAKVQVVRAFGLPGGRYIHCLTRLCPGSTAIHKTPSDGGEDFEGQNYMLTQSHDYQAKQKAPVWLDEPTVITPYPDRYNCLVVQVIGLKVVYQPSVDHTTPGHVTSKDGGAVTLDEDAVIGWAVVPLMKRQCVWSGLWRVPILAKRPDDEFLKELGENPVEEAFQRHKWSPGDFLDGASLDVKVWDAHFTEKQLPQGFRDQELLLEIIGSKDRCSLVRQEQSGKAISQLVLASLGKKYQKLGTNSYIYDREKDFVMQVMGQTFSDVVKMALEKPLVVPSVAQPGEDNTVD